MTPLVRHSQAPRILLALAPLAAILALLVAMPAGAASSCGQQVRDDWYDDGRVDRTYPLRCYDDAIEALPRDVLDYSSAKEDITRALQAAMRGEAPPPATADPSPGNPPTVTGRPPAKPPKPPTGQTTTQGEGETDPKEENTPEALGEDGGDGASSLPIPLLILAGLALLLIAGGSAGYLVRRYQGRNIPPPAV